MSTDLQLVLDNRINVSADATKVVHISGVQNNYYEMKPDGSSFTSNIVFNNVITPSLSNTLVSRRMRLRYVVQAVATNALAPALFNPGAPMYNATPAYASADAPVVAPSACLRAYPLQSVCDTLSLTLNGATTTLNSRQVISAIQRRLEKDYLKGVASECPVIADNVAILHADTRQAYAHVAVAAGVDVNAPVVFTGAPTSNQVLSTYYNSDGTTRGSFVPCYVSADFKTYQYEVSETLLLSPLSHMEDENYLANINTLSMVLNFTQLNDMFVFASQQAVPAGFAVSILTPVLELTYIQVPNDIVQIPRLVQYPYENVVYFTKTQTTLPTAGAAATSIQVQSDTLRLQSMPSLIYIFTRPTLQQRTSVAGGVSYTDAFFSLGLPTAGNGTLPNVSITLGNRSGLLSSASSQTLYQMSRRNGYNSTYEDFQYGSGSLLIIDPVQDLGVNLQAGDALPGESASVNFQYQATYSNINWVNSSLQGGVANQTPATELVIVCVYSGVVSLTPDNCIFNIGELSEAEVNHLLKTAPKDGSMISTEAIKPTIKGGSLYSKAKSVLGHVARGLQTVGKSDIVAKLAGAGISGAGISRRR